MATAVFTYEFFLCPENNNKNVYIKFSAHDAFLE